MQTDVEVVHIRLRKDVIRQIDHLAVDEDLYRQGTIEKLLAIGLEAVRNQGGRLPTSGAAA